MKVLEAGHNGDGDGGGFFRPGGESKVALSWHVELFLPLTKLLVN